MDIESFDLERFIEAQAPVYSSVRAELASGRKTSHWMWFVFPQMRALGRSATARKYGIESAAEAMAYLRHPILGQRLIECTKLALGVPERSAYDIFSTPDDMKFRSCMTLFAHVDTVEPSFTKALERFYEGRPDESTLALLRAAAT